MNENDYSLPAVTDALPTGTRPVLGIGGIVLDGAGRVLLIRRGQPPSKGLWSLPGGKQEAGETMQAACRREMREETGLEIEVGPIAAVVERQLEGFHYVIVDFLASLSPNQDNFPRAGDDVTDVRWVALAELGHFPLVDGLERVIHAADAMRRRDSGGGLADPDGSGSDYLAR
jgi:8-oxo-dGTP diphosphatase